MRGKIWYIDPSKSKFWVKIGSKCRNRLCQNLNFRFLKNSVSKKFGVEIRDINTKILIFKEFRFPKNKKSGPQNLKFDFDFEFFGQEIGFEI